ncbi:MAG: hypothetical protein QXZ06_04580, partial [Candidatus Jordarchaeales archaeon]
MEENNYWVLRKLRLIADYQFLPGAGKALFPENVNVYFSSKTGRVKEIRLGGELVASFRPDDGTFALSIRGAELLLRNFQKPRLRAIIEETVADVSRKQHGPQVVARYAIEEGELSRQRGKDAAQTSEAVIAQVERLQPQAVARLHRVQVLRRDVEGI